MANTQKADFELIIGADVALSTTQLRSDLETILKGIEKDPPKIKLDFDIDNKQVSESLKGKKVKVNELLDASSATKTLGGAEKHLQNISNSLNDILSTVKQINSKSMSINLGGDLFKKQSVGASVYKNELNEQLEYLNKLKSYFYEARDAIRQFEKANGPIGKSIKNESDIKGLTVEGDVTRKQYLYTALNTLGGTDIASFSKKLEDETQNAIKALSKEGTRPETLKKYVASLSSYINAYESTFKDIMPLVGKIPSITENLPSSAALDEAIAKTKQEEQSVAALNAQLAEQKKLAQENAAKGGMGSYIKSMLGQAEGTTSVAAETKAVGESLSQVGDAASSAAGQTKLFVQSTATLGETTQVVVKSLKGIRVALDEIDNSKIRSIEAGLIKDGVQGDDAKRLAEEYRGLSGYIQECKVDYQDFGDYGQHVSSLLIKAVDETGASFQKMVRWIPKVDENGQIFDFDKVVSGSAKYTASLDKVVDVGQNALKIVEQVSNYQSVLATAKSFGISGSDVELLEKVITDYSLLHSVLLDGEVGQSELNDATKSFATIGDFAVDSIQKQIAAEKGLESARVKSLSLIREMNRVNTELNAAEDVGLSVDDEDVAKLAAYRDSIKELFQAAQNKDIDLSSYLSGLNEAKIALGDSEQMVVANTKAIKDNIAAENQANAVRAKSISILREAEKLDDVVSKATIGDEGIPDDDISKLQRYIEGLRTLAKEAQDTNMSTAEYNNRLNALRNELGLSGDAVARYVQELDEQAAKEESVYNARVKSLALQKEISTLTKGAEEASKFGTGDDVKDIDSYRNALQDLYNDAQQGKYTLEEFNKALGDLRLQYESNAQAALGHVESIRQETASTREAIAVRAKANSLLAEADSLYELLGDAKLGETSDKNNQMLQEAADAVFDYAEGLRSLQADTQNANFTNAEFTSRLNELKAALGDNLRILEEYVNGEKDAIAVQANMVVSAQREAEQLSKLATSASKLGMPVEGDLSALNTYVNGLNELVVRAKNSKMSTAEFREELNRLKATLGSAGDGVKKYVDNIESGKKEEEKVTRLLEKAIKLRKEYADAIEKYKRAQHSANSGDRTAYEGLVRNQDAVKTLGSEYAATGGDADKLADDIRRLEGELRKNVTALESNGAGAETLGDKFAKIGGALTRYLAPLFSAHQLISTVRSMTSAVIELEDAFAQLQIVTGATDAELEDFYSVASGVANNLGKSITDITGSIEVFSRLGYSLSEATKLTEAAALLSNVADVTADAATTGLTSIVKGFGLQVADTEHVADVLINVGQKYAVSASELMDAFERSSAALAATDTSFDKAVAIVAAGNSAVQNANTVGTALKTISARIRGSKSDLEELGEDVEELADGFSKYAEELHAITGVDIMIEGTTNQFKDLYEIMDEVSAVWDKLSDTQQARTAEILGGTRQLQVIASIINNWGDAQKAYATAQNSAGEAARANSIYMETTTAHINQFKAAFQDLSHTIIDSDLLKGVVDIGTAILKMADGIAKFISSIGGLGPIIASLSSLVLILNGAGIVGALIKAGTSITSVIAGVKTGIGTIAAAAKGLTGVVTTLDVVSAGAASTVTSMASMASGIGVAILAASALAAIISKVNYEQAQQRETAMQAGDAAAKEGSAIVELVDKYRELNETGASNDAIIAARDEIAEKLGIERNEVEKLTREYGRFDEEIQKLTKDELERQRVTLQGAMNAARESLTASGYESASARRTINYGKDDSDSNNRAISSLQDHGFISRSSTGSQGSILNYDLGDLSSYQGVLDAFDRLHQMMNTLIADGNANTAVYQDIYNLYNQLKVGVDAYNNALSNLLTNELQQQYIANGIPKTASDYATMRAEMIAAVAASNDLGMGVEDATAAVDDFLSRQSGLSQFSNEVNNTFNSITSGAEAVALARSQFESMKDTFDDVTDSLKGITDVQNIIADGFVMDAQKAMELAEAYPGILDYATITADGQIKLNEDVANSFIAGKEAEIKAALTAKIAELEGDRALLVAKRDLAQAQLEMANQVARGKSELSVQELQNELNNQNAVTQALIEMGIDEAEAYRAVLKAMSDNTVTFDGNVADTAQNIAANMASASSSMATSFNANVKLMNVGMGVLVGNAHQVAAAVDAMGKGKVAGAIGYTDGGGNGQSINTFNRSFNQRSFGGVGVSYTPRTVQLNNIINQLDTDISGYTSAINAIDSQISALYTILNSSLSSVGSNRTGGGGGGRGGSGGGGGGGGGSGSGSSSKEETWFEKQYKLHQHYLNMDQETTEDFLKWLEKAYKQAYQEGIITLDEYYKYEEEIYKTYQKIKEAAKSTYDALVDYRVKMLKQERQNEKEALNDKLSDLKEYYSKQKELLQKQADEAKYIDEQGEKRKTVNDIKQQIAQLQFDTSAWAQKRREELLQQLSDAEKELQDFEDQHALEEALNALDEAYNAEEEKMNKQIEAIDDLLNDPEALYNQALQDINNNTEDLFKAFLLFNKKYGDGDDETIYKMWEEAFKNSEAFKSIFGSYYNDAPIGNYTGYTAPTPPTNPTPPAPSSGNSGGSSSSGSSSSSKSSAPSLASGSTVQVKTSATHFSPKSGSVRMASFVPGGQYTVYQTSGNEVLIGRNGVYTGWIYKTDIVGYKKGTKNATPGLHKINEEGTEAIFSSGDGQTYRMFSGGEKVLNAKATNFLYEFAMAGADILEKMRGKASDTFRNVGTVNQPIDITMGDIIINGDVSQQSVSEVRRAQREQINDVLKAFNRYQITLYRATK